ncbi:MAG: CPBP family intramembrane metalloprotease [Calditrichia bacterium]|nr:CPBP family intramembrane metalloprotease [Calditrichia bacterium]
MNDKQNIKTEPTPLIKYGWLRAILFLIAALITSAIFTFIGMMVLALIFGLDFSTIATNARDFIKDIGLPANITVAFFGFMGMLGMAWIFRRFIDGKTFYSLGFKFSEYKKDFLIGLLFGFILIASGFVILLILGNLSISDTNFNIPLLFGYVFLFTIGSLNEEIMIRGYILTNFCDSMNKYIALIVSSLLFAIMHLANANVTVLSFVNIFLAGILLGIYYIHKRNLWFPISLHFSWNFFQGPIFGFEVSGVDVTGVIIQDIQGPDLITGGTFGFEGSIIATLLMVISIVLLHYRYQEEK